MESVLERNVGVKKGVEVGFILRFPCANCRVLP